MSPHRTVLMSDQESSDGANTDPDEEDYISTNTHSALRESKMVNDSELELRRGRQMKEHYQTFRAPDIIKNIPRAFNTDQNNLPPPPVFNLLNNQRSRDTSLHTLKEDNHSNSNSNPNSKNSSLKSNNSTLKELQLQRRTSRFKSAFSAYSTDEAVESIAHPHVAYQRYQKQQALNQPQGPITVLKESQNVPSPFQPKKRMSISMDNSIIPAFDDLAMDLDDDQPNDNGSIDTKFDNSSLEEVHEEVENEDNTEGTKETVKKSNEPFVVTLGRVQQKLFHMKMAAVNEAESINNTGRFENIEQKVMFETTSNDVRSLRRFNQTPLVSSLRRVEKFTINPNTIKSQTYKPNSLKIPNSHPSLKLPAQINSQSKNIEDILSNATKILEELWEDDSNPQLTFFKNNGSFKKSTSTNSIPPFSTSFNLSPIVEYRELNNLPETRAIKEHYFEGYKLESATGPLQKNKSSGPSPKTTHI